jgi:NAD(P)-dependent dehydrogenase (short-subunit alcohol dehydrogenase family)
MNPGESLKDKVALVTGASSGIGRATARHFAAEGAFVGCVARNKNELAEVVREIEAAGGQAISLPADVSDSFAIEQATNRLVSGPQRLDIVVANAGINGVWAPIDELTPEEWETTIRINITGTFLTLRAAVPHLKSAGGSAILVSSINGNRVFSNTGACAYSSSKAAQVALGKMLALELAPAKVRVNIVCPGSIRTNIEESMERRSLDRIRPAVAYPRGTVPLGDGRPGTAEQVAQLIAFLASDAAAHITGTEIFIDGAESLLVG